MQYIVPIVVFVDAAKIKDARSKWQRDYIKVTVLGKLSSVIEQLNKPEEYRLDLDAIYQRLTDVKVSCEKELPLRKI